MTLLNADGSPALATRIARDRQGNVTSVDNGRGKAELAYNRCGYPISMKDPLGNVSKICYNAFNAPAFTPDANGIVTKYTDNNAGLATRLKRRDGSETLTSLDIAYDAAGRLVREGSKTYRYGYLDKVLLVTDGDTTRTYTYHADGQLASASNVAIGRAGAHASSDIASQCSLRSDDMRTPQPDDYICA